MSNFDHIESQISFLETAVHKLARKAGMAKKAGYTHYWKMTLGKDDLVFSDRAWQRIMQSAKKIIDQTKADRIEVAGPGGSGQPVISNNLIAFNGKSPEDYESFVLERVPSDQDMRFSFCKTDRRPYDIVVTSMLAAMKRASLRTVSLDSDGGPSVFSSVYK